MYIKHIPCSIILCLYQSEFSQRDEVARRLHICIWYGCVFIPVPSAVRIDFLKMNTQWGWQCKPETCRQGSWSGGGGAKNSLEAPAHELFKSLSSGKAHTLVQKVMRLGQAPLDELTSHVTQLIRDLNHVCRLPSHEWPQLSLCLT